MDTKRIWLLAGTWGEDANLQHCQWAPVGPPARLEVTDIDKVADWPAAINEIMPVGLQIMNGRVTEAFLRNTRLM